MMMGPFVCQCGGTDQNYAVIAYQNQAPSILPFTLPLVVTEPATKMEINWLLGWTNVTSLSIFWESSPS